MQMSAGCECYFVLGQDRNGGVFGHGRPPRKALYAQIPPGDTTIPGAPERGERRERIPLLIGLREDFN